MTFISIHPGKCEWMSGSVKTPGWQWLLSSHPNYGSEHNIAHIVGNKDDSSCPVEASFNVATNFSSQNALFFSSGRKCLILVSLRKAAWQSCHKQPRDLSLNHMCTTPPQCTIGVHCNIYHSFAVCFAIGECAEWTRVECNRKVWRREEWSKDEKREASCVLCQQTNNSGIHRDTQSLSSSWKAIVLYWFRNSQPVCRAPTKHGTIVSWRLVHCCTIFHLRSGLWNILY